MSAQQDAGLPLAASCVALTAKPLTLRLQQVLHTAAGNFHQREVLLLRVTLDIAGQLQHGYGEASALPGWSRDCHADNLALQQQLQLVLAREAMPVVLRQRQQYAASGRGIAAWHLDGLDERFPLLQQQPVLRFGIELAILDALARYQRLSLAAYLALLIARLPNAVAVEPGTAVAVQCTLGTADTAQCRQQLAKASAQGYTHAKLKVGVAAVSDDVQRIQRLLADFPDMTLRLDANAAWDTSQTLDVCHALAGTAVELIEQPVADAGFAALLRDYDHCGPLLAADESSVPAGRAADWMQSGRLQALVLKPSVHGGLLPALALLRLATQHRVKVVLSNLLEAAVARSAIAQLAAACPQHSGPHGLATGDWFAEDVVASRDRIDKASLQLRSGAGIGLDIVPDIGPDIGRSPDSAVWTVRD